jgi:drug/metabolite transporter (DMT)-like permease
VPDQFIYATRQVLAMHGIRRRPVLILLVGLVLFAPLFEVFDRSADVEQGTDLVLVLLSAFVSIGLFVICKRMIGLLFWLFLIAKIPVDASPLFPNRSVRPEISPPECLILLGCLRI